LENSQGAQARDARLPQQSELMKVIRLPTASSLLIRLFGNLGWSRLTSSFLYQSILSGCPQ